MGANDGLLSRKLHSWAKITRFLTLFTTRSLPTIYESKAFSDADKGGILTLFGRHPPTTNATFIDDGCGIYRQRMPPKKC